MARQINRLTARHLSSKMERGLHADGGGLYMSVKPSGAKSWCFVYRFNKKRRELGMGPCLSVSLAEARTKAATARALVAEGIDPKVARIAENDASQISFGSVAQRMIETLAPSWKNAKHAQQWRNTLATHASSLWSRRVDSINTEDILSILEPIGLK
jgi:Arm DNA-binding domain